MARVMKDNDEYLAQLIASGIPPEQANALVKKTNQGIEIEDSADKVAQSGTENDAEIGAIGENSAIPTDLFPTTDEMKFTPDPNESNEERVLREQRDEHRRLRLSDAQQSMVHHLVEQGMTRDSALTAAQKIIDTLDDSFRSDGVIELFDDIKGEPDVDVVTINLPIGAKKKTSPTPPPPADAFQNTQLSLFQNLLCNTDEQRQAASNSISAWNAIPKYFISQKQMNKMRDENGKLDLFEFPFANGKIVMQPAIVQEIGKDGVKITKSYYPSANEEILEKVLLKFATEQYTGFHEPNKISGVVFTIYQIKKELQRIGKSRSHDEIVKSLHILTGSLLEMSGQYGNKISLTKDAYMHGLGFIDNADQRDELNAKWIIKFHPMITDAIDSLEYRQYNYDKVMFNSKPLSRWLHEYLITKFTYASNFSTFDMRYSTIKQNSMLLEGYKVARQAVSECKESLEELKKNGVISKIVEKEERGAKNQIIDVVFTITATVEFCKEVKAANRRKLETLKFSP
jgi:hypothetical protein